MQAAPVTSEVDVEQLAADGKLKSLKVDVLKAYLKKHRLPVGGKKEDLIQRITRHVM